jgi:hypothetical protein
LALEYHHIVTKTSPKHHCLQLTVNLNMNSVIVHRDEKQMRWHVLPFIIVLSVLGQGSAASSGESGLPMPCALYQADFDRVWKATIDVIQARGEQVQSLSQKEGVIVTKFRVTNVEPSNDIATLIGSPDEWAKGRRFNLRILVSRAARNETKLSIIAPIQGWRILQGETMRPANWMPLSSNGTLEESIFNEISQGIRARREPCRTG